MNYVYYYKNEINNSEIFNELVFIVDAFMNHLHSFRFTYKAGYFVDVNERFLLHIPVQRRATDNASHSTINYYIDWLQTI